MKQKKSFIERCIHKTFEYTVVFNLFRKIIHNNFKLEHSIIKKELDLKKKTLDLGCGIGQHSSLFPPEAYVGLDIDLQCITYAQKTYPHKTFICHVKDKLPFPKHHFDQIMLFDTLHHLDVPTFQKLLQQFTFILPQKGKLFILDSYPVAHQSNFLGKFLFSLDRGKHAQCPSKLIPYFSNQYTLLKQYDVKTGPYRLYVLLLEKR